MSTTNTHYGSFPMYLFQPRHQTVAAKHYLVMTPQNRCFDAVTPYTVCATLLPQLRKICFNLLECTLQKFTIALDASRSLHSSSHTPYALYTASSSASSLSLKKSSRREKQQPQPVELAQSLIATLLQLLQKCQGLPSEVGYLWFLIRLHLLIYQHPAYRHLHLVERVRLVEQWCTQSPLTESKELWLRTCIQWLELTHSMSLKLKSITSSQQQDGNIFPVPKQRFFSNATTTTTTSTSYNTSTKDSNTTSMLVSPSNDIATFAHITMSIRSYVCTPVALVRAALNNPAMSSLMVRPMMTDTRSNDMRNNDIVGNTGNTTAVPSVLWNNNNNNISSNNISSNNNISTSCLTYDLLQAFQRAGCVDDTELLNWIGLFTCTNERQLLVLVELLQERLMQPLRQFYMALEREVGLPVVVTDADNDNSQQSIWQHVPIAQNWFQFGGTPLQLQAVYRSLRDGLLFAAPSQL
jgi:hypothetical protein